MITNRQISNQMDDTLTKYSSALTEKSTIVPDCQNLLDYIGDSGLPVSGRVKQFKSGDFNKINSVLKDPIKVNFARPTYHSYPNILGLYSLLTSMKMVLFREIKGKNHIFINPDQYQLWKHMTGAQKFIKLFMTWIKISTDKAVPMCRDLFRLMGDGEYIIKRDPTRENAILRNPGMDNLSLMGMFGFIHITQAEPELVEAWVPVSIAKTEFGVKIIDAVSHIT